MAKQRPEKTQPSAPQSNRPPQELGSPEAQQIAKVVGKDLRPEQISQLVEILDYHYSGPLPRPDHFERYAAVVEGGGDRILRMAEVEQAHRLDMDRRNAGVQDRVIDADIRRADRGQWMAYTILTLLILGSIALFALDRPTGGWAAFGGAIATALYNLFRPRFNEWRPWQDQRSTPPPEPSDKGRSDG